MTMIRFSNTSMEFPSRKIISDFSFEAAGESLIAVVGPSGAGKSTLLRLASGLLNPTSGKIERDFKKMGWAFQTTRLFPWLSTWRNIALPLENEGINVKEAGERAKALLSELHLEDVADSLPRQLSGGMAQRVSLARALAADPDFLFLDEPFSGLNESLRDQVRDVLINHIKKNKSLCFCSTHNLDIIEKFTNCIIEINPDATHQVRRSE